MQPLYEAHKHLITCTEHEGQVLKLASSRSTASRAVTMGIPW